MFYLMLATLCSASIALIFKYSETNGLNRYAVTASNYLTAVLVSGTILLIRGSVFSSSVDWSDSLGTIGLLLGQGGAAVTHSTGIIWAVISGLGAGIFFFLAFIFYQVSVNRYGVGLAGSFAKIGILVPMALSLVFWTEFPTTAQWLGIALAVASILMVTMPRKTSVKEALRLALLLLFLFGGMAEFSNKVYQKYGLLDYKALFLLATFAMAFICSVGAILFKDRSIHSRDILIGVAVGVPNLFSSYFLILALSQIPAAVAFPIYGAGTIIIINVVGLVVFKERLSHVELAAIGMTAVALILINL